MTESGEIVLVTTAYDLLMGQYGVNRGLAGQYPTDYDDEKEAVFDGCLLCAAGRWQSELSPESPPEPAVTYCAPSTR